MTKLRKLGEILNIGSVNYRIYESELLLKKMCDEIIPRFIIIHRFWVFGIYWDISHIIQDLLMPSTYAAVTALLKDTDAFK